MPKRRREGESKEERYARKLRKYENKLKEQQRVVISNDEEFDNNTFKDDLDNISIRSDEVDYDPWPDLPPVGDDTASHSEPKLDAVDCPITDTVNENSPVDPNVSDIEPDLLKVLGDLEPETEEWGPCAHEDIAKRFQLIMSQGLQKEVRDELTKKYLFLKNLPFAKAPTLNPEIATMLTDSFRNRDNRMLNKQEQLGRSLSALSLAMTSLLRKNPDLSEVVRILNDTGKLLADSHFMETDTRRAMIIPLIDKSLIELFKDRKRDNTLFGENLGELVKSSRGIKQTSQYIQSTVSLPRGSNLNWKGPPFRGRPQRGSQNHQYRTGGQRNQYANRRRGTAGTARRQTSAPRPPPPATTARRQPPVAAPRRPLQSDHLNN